MSNFILIQLTPSTGNDSSLVAGVRVFLATDVGVITFEGCRLLRDKQGLIRFSLSAHNVQGGSGRLPIVELVPNLVEQIRLAAIRAYESWQKSTNENKTIGGSNVPSDYVN